MVSKLQIEKIKKSSDPFITGFDAHKLLRAQFRWRIQLDLMESYQKRQDLQYIAGMFDAIGRVSYKDKQEIRFVLGANSSKLASDIKKILYKIGVIYTSEKKEEVSFKLETKKDCLLFCLLMDKRLHNLSKIEELECLLHTKEWKNPGSDLENEIPDSYKMSSSFPLNTNLEKSLYLTGTMEQRIYFEMIHYHRNGSFYFGIKVINNFFDRKRRFTDETPEHIKYLIKNFGGKYEQYIYFYNNKKYTSYRYIITSIVPEISPRLNPDSNHGFWKLIKYFSDYKFYNLYNKKQVEHFLKMYDLLLLGNDYKKEMKEGKRQIISEFKLLKSEQKKSKKNSEEKSINLEQSAAASSNKQKIDLEQQPVATIMKNKNIDND